MAKTMTVTDIITDFQRMYQEHWIYTWGSHATGNVDCSGAFVWSYANHGMYIYNGSNRIARVYVDKVIPYAEAKSKGLIVPGVAVFKTYQPTNVNYKLKSTYKPGGVYYNGDLLDYHHIGLYDGEYVLNAQGAKTGFVRSKITENWSHIGYLLAIDYGGGAIPVEEIKMMVGNLSPGTSTVNLRSNYSTNASVLTKLKDGTVVTRLGVTGEWSKVEAQGKTGWVMSKFLVAYKDKTLEERVAALEQRVTKLEGK